MLDGGTEHGRARGGPRRAPHGGVDGLGRARGEDHLAPGHADQVGHLVAGDLERVADDATLFVHPAGIAPSAVRPTASSAASASGRGGVVLAWSR